MKFNEPFNKQALRRVGNRWPRESHEFVEHVSNTAANLPPTSGFVFRFKLAYNSILLAENGSALTPTGDAELHNPEPFFRTEVLLLSDASVLAAVISQ